VCSTVGRDVVSYEPRDSVSRLTESLGWGADMYLTLFYFNYLLFFHHQAFSIVIKILTGTPARILRSYVCFSQSFLFSAFS